MSKSRYPRKRVRRVNLCPEQIRSLLNVVQLNHQKKSKLEDAIKSDALRKALRADQAIAALEEVNEEFRAVRDQHMVDMQVWNTALEEDPERAGPQPVLPKKPTLDNPEDYREYKLPFSVWAFAKAELAEFEKYPGDPQLMVEMCTQFGVDLDPDDYLADDEECEDVDENGNPYTPAPVEGDAAR